MDRRNFLRSIGAVAAAPILSKLPIAPEQTLATDYLTDWCETQGYKWSYLPTPVSWFLNKPVDWQAPKRLLVDCLNQPLVMNNLKIDGESHRVIITNVSGGAVITHCNFQAKAIRTALHFGVADIDRLIDVNCPLDQQSLIMIQRIAQNDYSGFSFNQCDINITDPNDLLPRIEHPSALPKLDYIDYSTQNNIDLYPTTLTKVAEYGKKATLSCIDTMFSPSIDMEHGYLPPTTPTAGRFTATSHLPAAFSQDSVRDTYNKHTRKRYLEAVKLFDMV